MTRKRHTEAKIIVVLAEAQAGASLQDFCRKHGISDAKFYKCRTKYAGLEVSDVKKLRQLEKENRRLKQMVADQALDIQTLKAITAKTGTAQGEEGGGSGGRRALWSEAATGVPVGGLRSEHAAILLLPMGRSRTLSENANDYRDPAAVWVPAHLCAAAPLRGKRRLGEVPRAIFHLWPL